MKQKLRPLELFMNMLFFLCGFITVVFVLFITVYLIISGLPAIREIGLVEFLFGTKWASTASEPSFGILPFILTSIYGTAGAILIGVPIGFFPALLWRGWRWWKALLLGCLTSCAIEFIQFFIRRSTDIHDVILNTTGALLGYRLFPLCRALCPGTLARSHCRPPEEC